MRNRQRGCLLVAAAFFGIGVCTAPASAIKPISKTGWVKGFLLTEYYPAPESWFEGKRVTMPGLSRKGRVDWLYSAQGISMEGDGIGTNGQRYHISGLGAGGWIAANGKPARFGVGGVFAPVWRTAPSWRNRRGAVTFPLEFGGWSNGAPRRTVPNRGITFKAGPSRQLRYLRSVASDPRLIPLGSLVYLETYATRSNPQLGWMYAEDTGGAIKGKHLDIYRRPPATKEGGSRVQRGKRVFVVPKRHVAEYLRRHPRSATLASDLRVPRPPQSILNRIALGRW